jgi:hypothetical protein
MSLRLRSFVIGFLSFAAFVLLLGAWSSARTSTVVSTSLTETSVAADEGTKLGYSNIQSRGTLTHINHFAHPRYADTCWTQNCMGKCGDDCACAKACKEKYGCSAMACNRME